MRAKVAYQRPRRHRGEHRGRVDTPAVDVTVGAAIEGGITADVSIRIGPADVGHRQLGRPDARMGMPLAQNLGTFGDSRKREDWIHPAVILTATVVADGHRAFDAVVF